MRDRTCPSVERLTEYCLGKLAVPEFDLLERHVDECHSCQDTVDKLDLGGDTFVANLREKPGSEPQLADPHTSEPALQAALAAARKSPATKLPAAKAIPQPAPVSPLTLAVKKWTEGAQPQSVDDFLSCVVTSQLLDVGAAREFLRSLPADKAVTDAKSAAVAFVNGGKLTAFQARALFQGKYQHLVVAEREILDLLGKGGMGNVYKARHRRLDRIEALKLISPKKLDAPEAKQRFAREARAAAKLNHPNVVTTYDAGEAGGLHFLAMEFIDGSDLARIVKERGPLSVEQAVSCTLQAAAGLQCAHTAGIVHRDIKPHNLLLDPQGKVKILDMGLARINDTIAADAAKEGLTQSGQIMGTIDFMSPEQTLDVHTVGPASDVYSLGCTLYYLLTGKVPFDGDSFGQKMMAHHHQPIPSLTAARAEVPAALDAVFQKMLAKKVEDRYGTMSEVIAALEKLGSASSTPVPLVSGRSGVDEGLDSFLSGQAVSQDMPQPVANAAQLAPTLVSTKPTPESRSRRISPAILAGAALLLAIIGVVAYLQVFTIRTTTGEVEFAVAPEYANEVRVIVTGGGKTIEVDKADDWKIKLEEGKYDVSLDPASKAKFTLDKQSVSVTEKNKEVVRVTLITSQSPAPPAESPKYVLQFDGDDYIDIPNFKYDGSHPLTFEARISDWMPPKNNSHPVFQSTFVDGDKHFGSWISFVGFGLDLSKSNTAIHIGSSARPGLVLPSSSRPRSETLIDLAVVFDGEKRAIFRNGKRVHNADFSFGSNETPKYTESRARLGGHASSEAQGGRGFRGYLQHVRISKTARYQSNHVPPETLDPDNDTLLLYRFNQPVGAVAKDLSPNKLDGKIVGAKSVPESDALKSVEPVPPPAEDLMLAFDGDDYIDIPNFRYDGSHPLTFEARLSEGVPLELSGGNHSVKLLDLLSNSAGKLSRNEIHLVTFGLDLEKLNPEYHATICSAEETRSYPSYPSSKQRKMTDLAVVFDGAATTIYLDGKLSLKSSFPQPKLTTKLEGYFARIGASATAKPGSVNGYRGHFQHIRISKTARYRTEYVPTETLESDADTMLLYRFDQDTGNIAKDLSTNKLDGQIVGAEWVSAVSVKANAREAGNNR